MTNASPSSVVLRIIAGLTVFAVHFITLFLVIVVLCSIVPKYAAFFEHGNIQLPAMTILLIDLSSFFVRYWYVMFFLGMLADAFIVVALTLVASKRNPLLSIYSHLWLLAVILFLSWVSIVLCVPIYALSKPNLTAAPPASAIPIQSTMRS